MKNDAEYLLNIEFQLSTDELWASKGYVVAEDQFQLKKKEALVLNAKKEALNIYLKGDSASQKKIALEEKQLIRSDLQGYEGLKGVKDQAIINQLADLVYQDPGLAYKIKGERSKYKPESYEEGAIYIDKGKIVKYKKGLFYTPSEPGFKG
jgi:hypothetical protein